MKQFTFSKNEKLKSRKYIEALFNEGKSVTAYPLKLIYKSTDGAAHANIKAGVSVSKRLHKKAVDRNRIKRLLREVYRLNKQQIFNSIEGDTHVMILYISKETPSFEGLNKRIKLLFSKFESSIKKDHEIKN